MQQYGAKGVIVADNMEKNYLEYMDSKNDEFTENVVDLEHWLV